MADCSQLFSSETSSETSFSFESIFLKRPGLFNALNRYQQKIKREDTKSPILIHSEMCGWSENFIIQWYIASEHNWNITTNKHGRLFKKYLNSEIWAKTEQTFSGSKLEDNWNALFAMAELFSEMGTKLSEKLGYKYPNKLEKDIRKYLNEVKAKK